jgi:hypothetical protein
MGECSSGNAGPVIAICEKCSCFGEMQLFRGLPKAFRAERWWSLGGALVSSALKLVKGAGN